MGLSKVALKISPTCDRSLSNGSMVRTLKMVPWGTVMSTIGAGAGGTFAGGGAIATLELVSGVVDELLGIGEVCTLLPEPRVVVARCVVEAGGILSAIPLAAEETTKLLTTVLTPSTWEASLAAAR